MRAILGRMSSAPRIVRIVAPLAALGCSVHAPEPGQAAPEPARVEVAASPVVEPMRSCPARAAAERHPLSNVTQAVQIGDRSFVRAWRRVGSEVETVIASLDERGALSVVPVPVPPADPLAIGADSGGLVIVSVPTRGTGTLLRVELGADGALRPGTPRALPEVVWGWPGQIESDGARAWLHHTTATAQQNIGESVIYTIDLAEGRVVATAKPGAGSEVTCRADACTTRTIVPSNDRGPARATFVRRARDGSETTLAVDVRSTCPQFYEIDAADGPVWVASGEPWRAVRSAASAPFLREAAIHSTLAPVPGCGWMLVPFPSTTHPGLISQDRVQRLLLPWDAAHETFGEGEVLPSIDFPRAVYGTHSDGVIEVTWSGGAGMMHSPTDERGSRRYFKHWQFDGGRVTLLRRERGRWRAIDPAPLALAEAEGTFHDGYMPAILRRGAHAAVLLAPEGGSDEALFQPFRAPCAGL